jgi:phospholipid-binding lipoprotein MlaA
MNRRPQAYLFIGFISLAVVTGCAHPKQTSTLTPSSPTMTTSNSQLEISSTNANGESPSEVEEKDSSFDEFEEEFKDDLIPVADPLEPWNRLMYHFNDKLYFWFFKPLARGYKFVVPEFARNGVNNFFRNLYTPIRFTNSLLQGKGTDAGNEFASFFVNSTWGILGFGAPAQSKLKIELSDEDLGQTFGAYGIGNGFYIVWPIIGPSTLRDTVGSVGDRFLNPVSYLDSTEASIAISLYDRLNETSFRIGEYEAIKAAAINPYDAIRNGYIQFRNAKIAE